MIKIVSICNTIKLSKLYKDKIANVKFDLIIYCNTYNFTILV